MESKRSAMVRFVLGPADWTSDDLGDQIDDLEKADKETYELLMKRFGQSKQVPAQKYALYTNWTIDDECAIPAVGSNRAGI